MKRARRRGWSRGLCAGSMVVASALILGTAWRAQAQDWKTYSYPADGFSASFPSQPAISSRDVATDAGSFQLRAYVGQVGDVAMFVGVTDYTASALAGKSADEILKGAKDGALENSKSTLTRESKMTLGVYPGLEFESEGGGNHFFARIYIVGTTLYQTLVVYPVASPYLGTARFLDSFQLIARVKN